MTPGRADRPGRWRQWPAALLAVTLTAALLTSRHAVLAWWTSAAQDREIARGAKVYASECAACHGTHLEGQPNWRSPGPDGLLPAPPHDATGHSWQHSDATLVRLVAEGPATFAAPGYRSAMPAYAGRLPAADIAAVIAYIKSTWPPGIRAYQATLNPGGPALPNQPGDWTFPPTCNPEPGAPTAELTGAGPTSSH